MKISKAIYRYISQAGYNNGHYRRLYDIAVRGTKEIGLDVTSSPKTIRLDVLPNKTCQLPPDLLNVLNVGVVNNVGQIASIMRDDTVTAFRKLNTEASRFNEDDFATAPVDNTRLRDFAYLNSINGSSDYKAFGAYSKTTFIGTYTIDEDTMILNPEFPYDYIIVEYMATIDEDDVEIPEIAEEALISYIAWKDSQYMPTGRKMNLSEKSIRRTEFYNQKRLLKSRIHPFLPSEARDVSFDNEKLIVK